MEFLQDVRFLSAMQTFEVFFCCDGPDPADDKPHSDHMTMSTWSRPTWTHLVPHISAFSPQSAALPMIPRGRPHVHSRLGLK